MRLLYAALLLSLLTAACTATRAEQHTVRGVLLEVRTASITKLDGFRLRADDGRELTFVGNDKLGQDLESSPGHLRGHMARVDHVTVTYHETGDGLVADRVQDS